VESPVYPLFYPQIPGGNIKILRAGGAGRRKRKDKKT
jgi:hypothetical protein